MFVNLNFLFIWSPSIPCEMCLPHLYLQLVTQYGNWNRNKICLSQEDSHTGLYSRFYNSRIQTNDPPHTTDWVDYTTEICFLTVKIKVQNDSGPGADFLPDLHSASYLFAIFLHGKESNDVLSSNKSQPYVNTLLVWHHLTLIISYNPLLQIHSHWGLGHQHMTCVVYN